MNADRMALEIEQETLAGIEVLDRGYDGEIRSVEGIIYRFTVTAIPEERTSFIELKAKVEGICIEVTDADETVRFDYRKDRAHLAY